METQENDPAQFGFVLVHGAFHGSWCWVRVADRLRESRSLVDAVDLPMTTLEDDARVVRDAIGRMRRRVSSVVVVGHSYGGVVVSASAHDADTLVYVAAGMPDAGESAASSADRMDVPAFDVSADGETITASGRVAAEAFYGRCSSADVEYALPRLRGLNVATQRGKIHDPAWRTVRSSYVVCTEDRALSPQYQRERASKLDRTVTIVSDHSPFFSATDELVAVIQEVAQPIGSGFISAKDGA